MIGSRETMGEEESGRITEGGKQSERRRGREKKERFFFIKMTNIKYVINCSVSITKEFLVSDDFVTLIL